jgi:hypothetical protein
MLTPKGWEGNYAYSSRVGGKLCLLLKGEREIMATYRSKNPRTLLRSGHKNPVINIPFDLQRFGS